MTEKELRARVVEQARSWLGYSENDGRHKKIVDLYNSYTPHPRGYAVKYTDAWCATYVSAVAISCGVDDIMPAECSCPIMISLYQRLGRWVEDDGHTPQPGDVIFYDWQDTGAGDNTGTSDHVGIVESVDGSTIVVLEGNCGNQVARRTLQVGGRYIRGYGVPDFASVAEFADAWLPDPEDKPAAEKVGVAENATTTSAETSQTEGGVTMCKAKLPQLSHGSKGRAVKSLQHLLLSRGCRLPKYGTDGDFGVETRAAVITFQKAAKIQADGIVGPATWAALIGG